MPRDLSARTLIADVLALTVSIGIASYAVLETPLPWASTIAVGSTWPMIVLLYLGTVVGNLLARQLWRTAVRRPSYVRAILIAATAFGAVALGALLTRMYWSRPFLLLTVSIWLGIMVGYRALLRSRPWEEAYLVITDHKELTDELAARPHAHIVAVLPCHADSVPELPGRIVSVVVDDSSALSDAVSRFVSDARQDGSPIRAFADVYEEHTGKVSIAHAADGWDAPMSIQRKAGYLPLKRAADIVAVIVMGPFAMLGAAAAMIWVKIDSRGHALFHQRRVGKDGGVFTIHKIRTMRDLAPPGSDRPPEADEERVTRAGGVLRRLHLDELPQLWNVLKGDLSIIGPRPEQVPLVADYETEIPFYSQRHVIRPGITGWAQVHHGYVHGVEETIEKLGHDLFYLKHMSVWLDLRILGRSVWAVVTGFGAK